MMADEKPTPRDGVLAYDLRGEGPDPALRVLVIAADRRFRDVAALLLRRRGCAVSMIASTGSLIELVERERPEVAVIDASGSRAWAARATAAVVAAEPSLGIVLVEESERPAGAANPASLAKWGSFELLFEAIERAAVERDAQVSRLEQS